MSNDIDKEQPQRGVGGEAPSGFAGGGGDASPYKVSLEAFEGPLDLLLHLIKKEDVAIYDIPISRLLTEYLQYIDLARELDIDLAGEFLEMAAELTLIKSRMLLPEPEGEEDEGPDPRADLVRKLLEYQRFKEAAQQLMKRPLLNQDVFARPPMDDERAPEVTIEADTLSLVSAFQEILKRLPQDRVHEISQPRMGVSERIIELTEKLKSGERVSFFDLFEGEKTRIDLVITFLAILEMAKQRLLTIIQEQVFHNIYVTPLFSDADNVTGLKGGQHGI